MFNIRDSGVNILFVNRITPGRKVDFSVKNGCSVILKVGAEDILVRDVMEVTEKSYTGTIYGFEPSHSIEFNGLKIGQSVEFLEQHIVSSENA